MNNPRKMSQIHCMSIAVLLIGILSIILLLWVEHVSSRLHIDEMLIDAVMAVQIRTATAHLRLEEIVRGEPEVDVETVIAELDQAVHLVNVILDGGEAENDDRIIEPLEDPGLRTRADAIKSLLLEFKAVGLARLRVPESPEKGQSFSQRFHWLFSEILGRTRQLEDIIEKDEAENQKKSRRLFLGITAIWALILVAATAGLWNREQQRERAEEELLRANKQLFSQAEELTNHREHLAKLVDARTADLAEANKRLLSEIVERERAEITVKESERQLRHLSARLMTAQETERRSISRELHDELGHDLTIVKLRLRSLERVLPGHAEIRKNCKDIMDYIDQTIENVRRLSRDLSPAILEDLGLTESLRWLAENFDRNFDGSIDLEIEDIDHLFSEDSRIMIYRVLQEALTNIGKHAQARHVSIVIRKIEEVVSFLIEDDGKGFSPTPSFMRDHAGKGVGLAIMEERVRMLGGVFEMQSQQERGTRIAFSVPSRKE